MQLPDRFLKRNEDLRIAIVVIQTDDGLRNARDQVAQDLALHGCEVEEAVDDQKTDVVEPRDLDMMSVEFAAQDGERAQLIESSSVSWLLLSRSV